MEIEEIQNKIVEFAEKRARIKKYELKEEISLIHIMEELGEVSRQIFNKKARSEKFSQENLNEEIIDVLLETLLLAKIEGIELTKELNNKIDELNKRVL